MAKFNTNISSSTKIRGAIEGNDDLLVEGHVIGNIRIAGHLEIAQTGRIEGDIEATSVSVQGELLGNTMAADKVVVDKSGRVKGNISAKTFGLADGGMINGTVETTTASTKRAPKATTTKASATPSPESNDEPELPESAVKRKVKVKSS